MQTVLETQSVTAAVANSLEARTGSDGWMDSHVRGAETNTAAFTLDITLNEAKAKGANLHDYVDVEIAGCQVWSTS